MTFSKKIKTRHKLSAIFVLSNILVIVSIWQIFQWSFNHSFVFYVTKHDKDFLEQMANRTANLYTYYNDWHFLVQENKIKKRWDQIRLKNLRNLIPPPDTPNLDLIYPSQYYRQRFLLFDKNQRNLIGDIPFDKAETYVVAVNRKIVGYVGLSSMRIMVQNRTLNFAKQQGIAFLMIATFLLALAALLIWPSAQWLNRPICIIREATKKLSEGKFETRIKIRSSDELTKLGNDFNHLATTLENTRESRKQWIADTVHELRTPIAILRGEIEAIQDEIIKVTPESLKSLNQEVMHITRLIDDLNQLSVHDMGNLNYKMNNVNLNDTLEQTIKSMSLICQEAKLNLGLEFKQKHQITVTGDTNRLHQLFANLINNSIKYTNSPGKLKITLQEKKNLAVILFEDTPPSVNEEERQHIFKKFYRVENSHNRTTRGIGLGLAICTNIVNGHQGTIKAYQSPEGGLGVRIEFPLN